MMISTKGRYALRVMLSLADHWEQGLLSLSEISARQEVSVKYLESIAAILHRAGLIRSQRGKEGGYQLSRPACEISVADILRSTEGTLAPVACSSLEGTPCHRADHCHALPLWQALDQKIENFLSTVTLEDVLKGQIALDT